MNNFKVQYRFSAKPRKYEGPAGWHFVSLLQKLSDELRNTFGSAEAGWGRLTATALIGRTVEIVVFI
jgi:hypothetical protein